MSALDSPFERGSHNSLPFLQLLPDEARSLVVESFSPASYPFGAVIASEGVRVDALYVIVSGRARVITRGEDGSDVPVGTLGAGDSFGEIELLQGRNHPTTVRASTEVVALRLDRSVFEALLKLHPDIVTYLDLRLKHRTLQKFFRDLPPFGALPTEAVIDFVLAELTPLVAEPGQLVVREGDPPGPLYLVEDGYLRAFRQDHGRTKFQRRLGPGDFFGETSVLQGLRRIASVEAVSPCRLLGLSAETYSNLLNNVPGFRARMAEHLARLDYKNVADVPSDFGHEMVPAEAAAPLAAAPSRDDEEAPASGDGRPFAEGDRFVKRGRRIWRFPLVRQIDESDCGAASLAMVCRYFGRAVSLTRIRQLAFTTVDGTSLRSLCHAAAELGLAARSAKVSPQHLPQMPLPAIVHWDTGHWLVLFHVGRTHVRVADPAAGRRRLSLDEFLRRWSGFAALFDYTDTFAQMPVTKPSLGWLATFVRPFSGVLVRALGLGLVVSVLQMVLPVFSQVVVDRVLVEHDGALLNLLVGTMAGMTVVMIAAMAVQRYLLSFVAVRIDAATLDYLTRRLLALPMSYFTTRRTGDIQRRLAGMREVRDFVVQHGVAALTAVLQLLVAVGLMALYSRWLSLVFLAVAPLYALLMWAAASLLCPVFDRLEEAFARYHSHQIDAVKGIETVKALGAENTFRALLLAQFHGVARRLFRADFTTLSFDGAIQVVTSLSLMLFLWAGAREVMAGRLTIGGFVAFNTLVALANGPILVLLGAWDQLQRSTVLINRINDVFEQEPEQGHDRSRLRPATGFTGHISVQNLGFRYGGPEAPVVLDNVTCEFPAGKRIAIVGRSGSGKTTLARCLAGLLLPTEGSIWYDGIELRSLNFQDLRRRIGVVLQDNHLFGDTIARNIAFADDDVDQDRVSWAAGIANAGEFIERLPLGYDTRIGETGMALSGGQRQRIAIARALYRKPPLLILDEATSSLDSESERIFQERMDGMGEGRTVIVIAHRLSTIRNADMIFVLEKGRMVEHGTHEALMARHGLYFYLTSQQLGDAS